MFIPYDKLEERWDGDERALLKAEWVVTEKIHGANFVVVGEPGERLRFAKRKELLQPGESFFGHELLVARLGDAFARAIELGRKQFPGATLLIYGELFGGGYPHPSVPALPSQKPVQTGVWYSPRLEFCAFDLAAVKDGARQLLAYDRALELFAEAGLFAAEPLHVGSLSSALAFPVERPSTVAARLGLPPLAEPNLAEGIVIKTVRTVAGVRPAFKRKIAAFAEDERYRGAEKPAGSPRHSGEALGQLLERAATLVNPPRAAAAVSKIGPGRAEEALALLRDEVLEELSSREPAAMAALTPSDRALLAGQIAVMAEALFS
jgi:Rnl2 family RNA ligase